MWEIGRWLGHYSDHLRPQAENRGTPSRMDKRVVPDKEGAADKQCLREGKLRSLWSQTATKARGTISVFPKTGYPCRTCFKSRRLKTERQKNNAMHENVKAKQFLDENATRTKKYSNPTQLYGVLGMTNTVWKKNLQKRTYMYNVYCNFMSCNFMSVIFSTPIHSKVIVTL